MIKDPATFTRICAVPQGISIYVRILTLYPFVAGNNTCTISLAFRERTSLFIPWLPLPVPVSYPVHYRVNNSLILPNHITVACGHVHSSMTVQFTANNTTLISVSLTDRVRELCCLKLYTFDNATLRCETKNILDVPSKAKSLLVNCS